MKYGDLFTTDQLIEELKKFKFTREIFRLQTHHTWKPTFASFKGDNHISMQDSMRQSHLNRGFSDIAQNLTLFPDSLWMVGRDWNTIPACSTNYNTGSLAIEIVGNFDVVGEGEYNSLGYDKFDGALREEYIKFSSAFFDFFNLPYDNDDANHFHRESQYTEKTCPGTSISKADIVAEIKKHMEGDTMDDNVLKIALRGYNGVEGLSNPLGLSTTKDMAGSLKHEKMASEVIMQRVERLKKLGYIETWENIEIVCVDHSSDTDKYLIAHPEIQVVSNSYGNNINKGYKEWPQLRICATGYKDKNILALTDEWVAIGSVDKDMNPVEWINQTDGAIDYVTYEEFETSLGTTKGYSFACPCFVGDLVGIYFNFKRKYGRWPSNNEVMYNVWLIAVDVYEKGKDLKTGHGFFEYNGQEPLSNDNMPSEWAKEAQKWAIQQGLTNGTNPKSPMTREQYWVSEYRKVEK